MRNSVLVAFAALALSGCQSVPPEQVDDPMVFARVDCRFMTGNPELTQVFQQDTAICSGRAAAAADSGTSAMHGQGIIGGMDKALTQGRINQATIISCMAERGYLFKKKSEHLAVCAVINASKNKDKARR